jgi:DNA-binding response OmpR family regulator
VVTAQKRILVVDDDSTLRQMLRSALQEEGYDVSLAANGAELRERLQEQRFNLVVLDAVFPGGERGIDLANLVMRARIDVMMMTGDPFYGDGIVGLKFPVLKKPFSMQKFVTEIRRCLGR